MVDLRKKVHGTIHREGEKALFLLDESAGNYFLACALVERGNEREIFPESLLDDWGHEIANLSLYRWIQDNGLHFPRAEVFGYDRSGNGIQCFIRDLDLMAKFPCYVFEKRQQALSEGVQVVAIGLPDSTLLQPERTKNLQDIDWPLANANVHWWRMDPDSSPECIQTVIVESS